MKRKYWLAVIGVLSLLYLVWLLYFAQVRRLDADEGFYTVAAKLAWEGKVPYRDFMFSQGAAIPYLYGWIWSLHPQSLVSMRFLSAVLGSVTVFLWGLFLISIKRMPVSVALSMFLMILLNPHWISWHAVVKTFAVADLLISVVIMCLYFGIQSGSPRWYAAAGLALGVCASMRALYGPLIVVVLAWVVLLEWRESERSLRRARAYLGGAVCGILPMILSFAVDPAAFLFNNFKYRPLLDTYISTTFSQTVHEHLTGISNVLRSRYFTLELVLAALGIISFLELRKKKDGPHTGRDYRFLQLVFLMMVVYAATALLPLPTYPQYFDSPLLPFLVFFIAEGLRVTYQVSWKWAVVLAIVAPIFCWRGVSPELTSLMQPRFRLSSYRQVAEVIRENSAADATVLSVWPGYVFESGRRCFPGTENEFVYEVANKVPSAVRQRYHLVGKEEVMRAISTGVPDIYIGPLWYLTVTMSKAEEEALGAAVDAHYVLVKKVDGVKIYGKKTMANLPQGHYATALK
jgi:hypothetical protein